MDTFVPDDADRKRQKVDEVMRTAAFPREITGYDVEFGEDHYGGPTLFVNLHVLHDVRLPEEEMRRLVDTIMSLNRALRIAIPDFEPHVWPR